MCLTEWRLIANKDASNSNWLMSWKSISVLYFFLCWHEKSFTRRNLIVRLTLPESLVCWTGVALSLGSHTLRDVHIPYLVAGLRCTVQCRWRGRVVSGGAIKSRNKHHLVFRSVGLLATQSKHIQEKQLDFIKVNHWIYGFISVMVLRIT